MGNASLKFTHQYIPGVREELPTLLLLHGTGGNEQDLIPLGRSLLPGAGLLSPRGKVLENGKPRFFRRLAEGIFDLEDLVVRTHELADFVVSAAAAYGFDGNRVIAVGYSNGANIAASTLLLRPYDLSGAVLFHPMAPLIPEVSPNLSGKPVFIGAGRQDRIASISETERLTNLLRATGADVRVFWRPGGHELGGDEAAAAKAWLTELYARDRRPMARAA